MSQLPKRKRISKKQGNESKFSRERVLKPAGSPPSATVEARHDGDIVTRAARGYSWEEVRQAGVNPGLARGWGLRIDGRRRSVIEGNIDSLTKWSSQARKSTAAGVEGELHKIERMVGKEARKVEREIERAEKEVVEKVEAPIKKRTKKAEPKAKTA